MPPNLNEAIHIIRMTPGYAAVGADLSQIASQKRIRIDSSLDARAETRLSGAIVLGAEALASSPPSLAQTLVHEHFHLRRQHPLQKTVSFLSGVFSKSHVMKRFEQPAYQAANDLLEAVKMAQPALLVEANAEQAAIRQVFATDFGGQFV
jgi:hypothetical protein